MGAHSLHFNVHIVERTFLRSWTRMVLSSFFTIYQSADPLSTARGYSPTWPTHPHTPALWTVMLLIHTTPSPMKAGTVGYLLVSLSESQRVGIVSRCLLTIELYVMFTLINTQHPQDPALPPPGYARHDTSDY